MAPKTEDSVKQIDHLIPCARQGPQGAECWERCQHDHRRQEGQASARTLSNNVADGFLVPACLFGLPL